MHVLSKLYLHRLSKCYLIAIKVLQADLEMTVCREMYLYRLSDTHRGPLHESYSASLCRSNMLTLSQYLHIYNSKACNGISCNFFLEVSLIIMWPSTTLSQATKLLFACTGMETAQHTAKHLIIYWGLLKGAWMCSKQQINRFFQKFWMFLYQISSCH